jgi:hypothetical protein
MKAKTLLGALALALGLTALLVLISSAVPIRWDHKSIAPNLPQFTGDAPPGDRGFVFVTADESTQNHHLARYGLDFLTFPNGEHAWLVLLEGTSEGPVSADYAIDASGRFHAYSAADGWQPLASPPPAVARIARHGTLLLSSLDLFEPIAERWPAARSASVVELDKWGGSFFAKPQLRYSLTSFAKTWWVLSIVSLCLAAAACYARQKNRGRSEVWLCCCLVPPCWLALHSYAVYLFGWITPHPVPAALGLQSLMALATLLFWPLPAGPAGPAAPGSGAQRSLGPAVCFSLALAALTFCALSVVRLDFDGDLFTHWIPSARLHHLLGHHDPMALLQRYGAVHETTYPPGFPIFISTVLWMADSSQSASFGLGHDSHLAILLYRCFIVALHLSFLIGTAAFFRAMDGQRDNLRWLLPVIAIPLILPLFMGKPTSSEVYMVPILGFSILALAHAGWSRQAGYARLGLGLALFGLFLKNDAFLSLPLILLPWYFAYLTERRPLHLVSLLKDILAIVIGLAPWLIWRMDLAGLNVDANFMFEPVNLSRLAQEFDRAFPLALNAFKIIVKGSFWLVLLVAMPATFVYQLARRQRKHALMIPLAIWCYASGLVFIYVFSRSDAVSHMNTSYDRLLMIAVLSGILYCARELLGQPARHAEA